MDMGKSPRVRANAATTAVLTQWVIENREALTQSPIHADAVSRRFTRETGVSTTTFAIRQVFGAVEVPLAHKKRKVERRSTAGRIDRLIAEVVSLHSQLSELARSLGETIHMSAGLKALKERRPDPAEFPPDKDGEDVTPRWGEE